jgi:hypothetical protein
LRFDPRRLFNSFLEGDMTRRWKTERSERRRFLATFAVLSFASFLMALDYCTFVKWGGLYPAGATGLAMLIQRMLQKVVEMIGWGGHNPFFSDQYRPERDTGLDRI